MGAILARPPPAAQRGCCRRALRRAFAVKLQLGKAVEKPRCDVEVIKHHRHLARVAGDLRMSVGCRCAIHVMFNSGVARKLLSHSVAASTQRRTVNPSPWCARTTES